MLAPVMTHARGRPHLLARRAAPGGRRPARPARPRRRARGRRGRGRAHLLRGHARRVAARAHGGARRPRHAGGPRRLPGRVARRPPRRRTRASASRRAAGSRSSSTRSSRSRPLRGARRRRTARSRSPASSPRRSTAAGRTSTRRTSASSTRPGTPASSRRASGLGSGDFLPGYDVHLNSMLGESDLLIGPLEPGKRMESMMAPTVALDDDGLVLAAGAAGGTRLRPALAQVLSGILDEGLAPAGGGRPAAAPLDRARSSTSSPASRTARSRRSRDARLRRPPLGRAPPLLRRRQRRRGAGARRPTRGAAGSRSALALLAGPARPPRAASTSAAIWATRSSSLANARSSRSRSQSSSRRRRPVEVALEVEQERLDPALAAAVVRVDADRGGHAVPERLAGVDPVGGHEQCGSGERLAVGKPSVPPRWSP